MTDSVLTLLGFAQKSGKLATGHEGIIRQVKMKKVALFILANDAPDKRVKDIEILADTNRIPLIRYGTCEELGRSIGRSVSGGVAVIDPRFAEAILHHTDGREKK